MHGIVVPGPADAWQLYRLFATEAWDAAISTVAFGGLQDRANGLASMARGNAAVVDLELDRLLVDVAANRWSLPV